MLNRSVWPPVRACFSAAESPASVGSGDPRLRPAIRPDLVRNDADRDPRLVVVLVEPLEWFDELLHDREAAFVRVRLARGVEQLRSVELKVDDRSTRPTRPERDLVPRIRRPQALPGRIPLGLLPVEHREPGVHRAGPGAERLDPLRSANNHVRRRPGVRRPAGGVGTVECQPVVGVLGELAACELEKRLIYEEQLLPSDRGATPLVRLLGPPPRPLRLL